MEKRSVRFYTVSFLYMLLSVFSFGAGTGSMIDFFRNTKSTSLFTEIGLPLLGAIAFMLGYFFNAFGTPTSTKPLLRTACSLAVWSILLFVFMVLTIWNRGHPVSDLFRSIVSYSFAGMFFVRASNRFRKAIKT